MASNIAGEAVIMLAFAVLSIVMKVHPNSSVKFDTDTVFTGKFDDFD
jgi:hypothetical protein